MSDESAFESFCPQCGARIRVPQPGTYRCPRCEGVLEVKPPHAPAGAAPPSVTPPATPPEGSPETPDETPPPPAADDTGFRLSPDEPAESPAPSTTCAFHPDRPAEVVCQTCGKLACDECFSILDGNVVCVECSARQLRTQAAYRQPTGAYPPPPPPSFAGPNPWEGDASAMPGGFFRAIGAAMFKPREFFARMRVGSMLMRAVVFGILIKTIVNLNGILIMWLQMRGADFENQLQTLSADLPPEFAAILEKVLNEFVFSGTWLALSALSTPISAAMSVLMMAMIVHLFLWMFGGANAGIEATIKVTCYSYAAQVFSLLPICGGIIGIVWQIVILSVGLSVVHRTTTGKGAAAALAPIALVVAFSFLIGIILVIAFAAGISG